KTPPQRPPPPVVSTSFGTGREPASSSITSTRPAGGALPRFTSFPPRRVYQSTIARTEGSSRPVSSAPRPRDTCASASRTSARPGRRTLVVEPASSAPYPPETTRVRFTAANAAESGWERLAVGLGADVVVLDDVLRGGAIEGVLGCASVGRLVFAKTDWLDGR